MGYLLKERLQSVGHSADPLEVLPVEHSTRISISHAPVSVLGLPRGAKEMRGINQPVHTQFRAPAHFDLFGTVTRNSVCAIFICHDATIKRSEQ
jgi:hypothetical protein